MRWRARSTPNRLNAHKRAGHRPRSLTERLAKTALPGIAILGLVLAAWIATNVFRSDRWFAIHKIVVEGQLAHVTPDQVIGLLEFKRGESLLFTDLNRALQGLYHHPWIKDARLERRYPHTLAVTVLEETPIAILSGPHYTYLNRDGHPFKEVEKGEDMDLPLFSLPARPGLSMPSDDQEKIVHEMIDFLNKYKDTRFASEFGLSEVVAREGGFTFFTKKGGLQIECSESDIDDELYKLDKYYPDILAARNPVGILNLRIKGKIIASARN